MKTQNSGNPRKGETKPEFMNPSTHLVDHDSEESLKRMSETEEVANNSIPGIKFVLFILSSKGMVYDMEALRQKVLLSYPDAVVFFQTTLGKAIGPSAPQQIDLIIDFTGPGQRQGFFFARKIRRMARVVVGRNAGWFRKRIYNSVFDESEHAAELPQEALQRERYVQRKVLHLAGIAMIQAGEASADRSKTIALELPSMQRL